MDVDGVDDYVSLVDEMMDVLKLNKQQIRTDEDEAHVLHTLLLPHKHMNDPLGTRMSRQRSCNSLHVGEVFLFTSSRAFCGQTSLYGHHKKRDYV